MALDIGTLVGYLDLDTRVFDRRLDRTEDTAKKAGAKSGRSHGEAFDKESSRGHRSALGRLLKGSDDAGDDAGRRMGTRMTRSLMRSINDSSPRLAGGFRKLLGGLTAVASASMKPVAAAAAVGFVVPFLAQVAAGLASGAKKIAAGLGSALALLPAVAVAAGLVLGTLKVAFSGVGDALKSALSDDAETFAKAIEGLSPPARVFARQVRSLRGDLKDLKTTVQGNLFGPLEDNVRPLGERYLPMVEAVLGRLATRFGEVGSRVAGFLATPGAAFRLGTAMNNSERAVGNLTDGVGNLVRAFVPLISVGSTFLPGFTAGFDGLAARLARAATEAERTGRMREWIADGLSGIGELVKTGGSLVQIFRNIGSIGSTIFAAMGVKTGGLLRSIEKLTGQADKFLKSAKGVKVLETVFGTLGKLVDGFRTTLSRVVDIVGEVFGPLIPDALDLVMALSDLKAAVFDVGLDALEPILQGLGGALGVVLPLLTRLAGWLADHKPVIQGIGIAITALLVPAFVAWAISAGTAAIATLLAMAPLILLGAAIAGLAALVIIHFDTIKRWISNVFNWARDHWPLLVGILTGPFGLVVGIVATHWDTIWRGIVGIKNRIADIGGYMWDGLRGGLAAVVNWVLGKLESIINGMIRAYNAIPEWMDPMSGDLAPVSLPRVSGTVGRSGGGPSGQFSSGGIRRMHSGGRNLTSDEMLLIIQSGEEVLARADPRNRANAGHMSAHPSSAAAAGAGAPVVMIRWERSGHPLDDAVMDMLKHRIRVDGGDVQLALT